MNAFFKFMIGFAAIIALGIISIEMNILPGSRTEVQARVQALAEERLQTRGADWAEVRMAGQKAVLSGEAPDEAALETVATALSGGVLAGGVTTVDVSGVAIAAPAPPVADPFIWVAERHGGDIVFSGYVPSAAARETVRRLAAQYFPGADISGEMAVARGAPPEEAWLSAAETSLEALAQLEDGAAQAADAEFQVSGRAADKDRAQLIRMLMASLPAGVAGTSDVTTPPPPEAAPAEPEAETDRPEERTAAAANDREPADQAASDIVAEPAEPAPGPDAATPDRAQASEEEPAPGDTPAAAETETGAQEESAPVDPAVFAACRARLEGIIGGLQVSFASRSASLDPASEERLLEFATGLLVCPYFRVDITGHTDSSGDERRNQRLSRERAETVAAFLRSFGVDDARLATRGAGSSDPLADNSTPEGRALNRRIEFTLAADTVD